MLTHEDKSNRHHTTKRRARELEELESSVKSIFQRKAKKRGGGIVRACATPCWVFPINASFHAWNLVLMRNRAGQKKGQRLDHFARGQKQAGIKQFGDMNTIWWFCFVFLDQGTIILKRVECSWIWKKLKFCQIISALKKPTTTTQVFVAFAFV